METVRLPGEGGEGRACARTWSWLRRGRRSTEGRVSVNRIKHSDAHNTEE
jgi:hypothetical protein